MAAPELPSVSAPSVTKVVPAKKAASSALPKGYSFGEEETPAKKRISVAEKRAAQKAASDAKKEAAAAAKAEREAAAEAAKASKEAAPVTQQYDGTENDIVV